MEWLRGVGALVPRGGECPGVACHALARGAQRSGPRGAARAARTALAVEVLDLGTDGGRALRQQVRFRIAMAFEVKSDSQTGITAIQNGNSRAMTFVRDAYSTSIKWQNHLFY